MTTWTRPDLDSIPGYIPGRTRPGAIKLASNETTHGPLPSVVQAIVAAAGTVNRYPDNRSSALVRALADFLAVDEDTLAIGCGSVALCQELVQATCGPGDEVIFGWRSFEAYPIVVQVAGATAVRVPLGPGFVHDLDALAAAVTDRTRLVYVCNPNNPTGTAVTRADLDRFLDAVPETVLVALDEAYYEYYRGDIDGVAVWRERPNVVVLRTFSKAYGLAGLRVGYAVGPASVIEAMAKVHVAFSVSAVAQAAAIASLEARDELLARTDAVIAERERVARELRAIGIDVTDSQANFLWMPLGEQSPEFTAAAAEAGVLLRAYGTEGVRVSIGDPEENQRFLEFVRAQ